MQPQSMQLFQTPTQQNIMGSQNGYPILLSNFSNVNQLQSAQQALLLSQQQMQQQTQQQQYVAAMLLQQQQQQQQRQILMSQPQYNLVYQLNKQPQINSCFNNQLTQNKLLITPQTTGQMSNMMYNIQPGYNYPMYVQPVMSQPATQQVQFIPLTQNRTDQTLNVAKPFENLTNFCQNQNISTPSLDQLPLMQKGNSQNLNFSQVFLNQSQGEGNSILQSSSLENQLSSLNSDMILNKQNSQNIKETIESQLHILNLKSNQISGQNTTKDDEQTSQISKTSCSRAIINENPRRGFRLSNHDTKTLSIQQMSPQFSDSPLDTEKERLKLRNPPIISKPIKKMSKDGSFQEDKSGQNEFLSSQYTIRIKKVDNSTLVLDESRSKSDTKVLIGFNPFSEKETDIQENMSQLQEENCQDQIKEIKNQHDNQNSETSIQSSMGNQKDLSISKMDEANFGQQIMVNSLKQDTEKLVETLQEANTKADSTQMNSQTHQISYEKEEIENSIENDNKMESELCDNESVHESKLDDCTQSQQSAGKNSSHEIESQSEKLEEEQEDEEEEEEEETPRKQQKKKKIQKLKPRKELQKKKQVKKTKALKKKKLMSLKHKEDYFRCSSNIQLENVLPTKTRGQQVTLQTKQPKESNKPQPEQEQDQSQNIYQNVDVFQEATQGIMNQFEKYNIKNLKKNDNLIEEFKKFMGNVKKNDEYISQLLNPVECNFSDNFIEFLRGPAQKWIKKNIEQKKQAVYNQLVNIFKSEDRSSSCLRPRKTRAGSNYSQK